MLPRFSCYVRSKVWHVIFWTARDMWCHTQAYVCSYVMNVVFMIHPNTYRCSCPDLWLHRWCWSDLAIQCPVSRNRNQTHWLHTFKFWSELLHTYPRCRSDVSPMHSRSYQTPRRYWHFWTCGDLLQWSLGDSVWWPLEYHWCSSGL